MVRAFLFPPSMETVRCQHQPTRHQERRQVVHDPSDLLPFVYERPSQKPVAEDEIELLPVPGHGQQVGLSE